MVFLKNPLDRPVIVYLSPEHKPEESFPIHPQSVAIIEMNDEQLSYVRENYPYLYISKGE